MTFTLTKSFRRLWSLEAGMAMVVTDLHGDGDAYRCYRDRFVDLQAKGQADCLILTGDLIHSDASDLPDESLEIVLDVLALQASYGQAILYLCGNHEMPHLYGISLSKGRHLYTPSFETAMNDSRRRDEIMDLFDSLPFYIRTQAGVSLAHAGAVAPMAIAKNMSKILDWDHQKLIAWADEIITTEGVENLRNAYAKLSQVDYATLAEYYLAVSEPDDLRYDDLLRGFLASNHPEFNELLWPVLFTRCEQEYGQTDYAIFLDAMLQEFSVDFFPQQVLVAGHMKLRGGHQIVAERHLRLASAHHAQPHEAGQYLLFDTTQPIQSVDDLLSGLGSVY